jgi:hypothetical protein
LLKIIEELPDLNELILENLNLGDQFCIKLSSYLQRKIQKNIKNEKKNLIISDVDSQLNIMSINLINNPRISNTGIKYLYIVFKTLRDI